MLNVAILTLPPKYFADMPLSQRQNFLWELSCDPEDTRLDYNKGYLGYYSDWDPSISASCGFYIKLLQRKDDTPLFFVYMPKSWATGLKPKKNQTYILEYSDHDKNSWKDVTSKFLNNIDITMHFVPERDSNIIEVGPYTRTKRYDGRGFAYIPEVRILDLEWSGSKCERKTPSSKKFIKDE